ncbi:acetylcholinesterase-like [Lycorma delicatula]|uniref:acetylcholinesterase-like n=1 Tax=Lycorma delicatula TaxID=130591 RepID=UPI003F51A594
MVWIHGGGFTYNSAVEDAYGAGLLIEHGVVLVSLNYRVGAFGFLNMLNQHVPGNAGLKDQVLALKWVKHNIYNFGGDPLDITIFGESAGSASVQYHTLSPLSQGLFHRIIMESGSALNPWAFTEEPRVRAFQLGKLLSFNGTDDNELIEYLQKIPADELIEAQNQIINNEYAKQCLDFPFLPSIEVKGTGSNFLTEHPRSLLERGEFAHVPAIIGINSKEGILSLTDAFKTKKDYGDYYGNFIPEELHLVNGSEKYNELADEIKAFFFYNKPVDVNNLDAFTNVCGDIAFVIGIYETINYFLNYSDSVYIYEFTFEGKLGFLRKAIQSMRPDLKVPAGVSHADELGYIFPSKKIKYLDTSSPELKIVHVMTNMWTKFAKTSTPTEKINASFYWEPASKEKLNHLDINNPLKLEGTIFLPERITFWDDILENTHLNNNQQNVLYNASVQ